MYDPLVYHLDLCILAYQLHAQTLIWPMDPYYEQMRFLLPEPRLVLLPSEADRKEKQRKAFMDETRRTLQGQFAVRGFRGPGFYIGTPQQGWDRNQHLDPITNDYRQINPWRPGLTRPFSQKEPWIVYNTPGSITDKIASVYLARYDTANGPYANPPAVDQAGLANPLLQNPNLIVAPVPTDLLYCFEGGTGAVPGRNNDRDKCSWSLMGFVLARQCDASDLGANLPNPAPYDIHIVFRGSRSGKLRGLEAWGKQKGNPDWVTDLQLLRWAMPYPEISQNGAVLKGFAESVKTMFPTIIRCLQEISQKKQAAPRTIWITGHSLGGALACHFASAIATGNVYGPYGQNLPRIQGGAPPRGTVQINNWPWDQVKLLTYGAPEEGDLPFKIAFDAAQPSHRIWLYGDPITTEARPGAIGTTRYRIPQGTYKQAMGGVPITIGGKRISTTAHEPLWIRRCMLIHTARPNPYPAPNPNNFPRPAIPVPTGKQDQDEPWRVWSTLRRTLAHLAYLRNGQIHPCLTGFIPNALQYLDFLERSVRANAQQRGIPARTLWLFSFSNAINGLRVAIQNLRNSARNGVPRIPALDNLHQDLLVARQSVQAINGDLYDFAGCCLILAFLSLPQYGVVARPQANANTIDAWVPQVDAQLTTPNTCPEFARVMRLVSNSSPDSGWP